MLVAAFVCFAWACFKKHTATEPATPVNTTSTAFNPSGCAKCHAEKHYEWQNSHHALALRLPHDTLFRKIPDTIQLSQHRTYYIFKQNDSFKLVTNDYIHPGAALPIKYVIGVHPLIQYVISTTNGREQCLTFAYDVGKKEYFDLNYAPNTPVGDWLHWTGQAMNWNSNCADCHSTLVKKNYNPTTQTYHTTFRHIQITCEACHGTVKQLPTNTNACTLIPSDRINVKDQKAQINVCAPCHSRRLQLTDHKNIGDIFLDHYLPEPMNERTFHADGQILDEVFEYHSYTQSKMYEKGVKCSNCHNMHTGKMLLAGNATCTQCHAKDTFDTPKHHFHAINSAGASCVNCHMPGKYYMQRHFRHDHSIRIPRPDLSAKYGTPNACNVCHKNKTPQWAAKEIEKRHGKPKLNFADAVFSTQPNEIIEWIKNAEKSDAIRNLALNAYMKNVSNTPNTDILLTNLTTDNSPYMQILAMQNVTDKQTFIPQLSKLVNSPVKSVQIEAAKQLLYLKMGNNVLPQANQAWNNMLHFNNDNPSVVFDAANIKFINEQPYEALKLYKNAIMLDNQMPLYYQNIAQLFNSLQQNDSALHYLEIGKKLVPQSAELWFYTGLIYAESNNMVKAIENVEKAFVMQPNGQYAYNLSVLYIQTSNYKKASEYIKAALKYEPENPKYKQTKLYISTETTAKKPQ